MTVTDDHVPIAADAAPIDHAPAPSAPLTPPVATTLAPLRIFLAVGWLRAGVEKLIDRSWWRGDGVRGFLSAYDDQALAWFRPLGTHLFSPLAPAVAVVVLLLELGCGAALAVKRGMRVALWCGVLLNVTFVAAGRVNPSAFYLVMEIVLLAACAELGRATRPSQRRVRAAAGIGVGAALACLPSVRTLEPAQVIDDPALMLAFCSLLAAVTLLLRSSASAVAVAQRQPSRLARAAWWWAVPWSAPPAITPKRARPGGRAATTTHLPADS